MFNKKGIKLGLLCFGMALSLMYSGQVVDAAGATTPSNNGIFDVPTSQYVFFREAPRDEDFYAPSYDGQGNLLDTKDSANWVFGYNVSMSEYSNIEYMTVPVPAEGTRFNLLQGTTYNYAKINGQLHYASQNDTTAYAVMDSMPTSSHIQYMGLGKLQITFQKDGQDIKLPDANGKAVANPETLYFLNNDKDNKPNTAALIDQLKKLTVTIAGETYHLDGTPSVADTIYKMPSYFTRISERTVTKNQNISVPSGDVQATFTQFTASSSSDQQPITSSSSPESSSTGTSSTSGPSNVKTPKLKRAVSGLKRLSLYSRPDFSKRTREVTYAKKSRTKRPQFIVTGYAQSKNGTPRYLVKDVTKGSKTYGKTGYITTKPSYVGDTYYQKAPKAVRVIGNHGLNAYKTAKLSKAVKHYRHGQTLKIKGLVKYHRTTRLILTNGHYVSANKTLVIEK